MWNKSRLVDKILHEALNENLGKLIELAKKYDYNTFLDKTDSVVRIYDILYRGMTDGDRLTDFSFMTDYIGHARGYGDDNVDGIIYEYNDVLTFNDAVFNNLRKSFSNISKKELNSIYSYYFSNDKLLDAMGEEYGNEKSVINFVFKFIKSDISYIKVQQNKVKNDLLIPIMLHYAKQINKNIISFLGGDYSDYGGANEYVVRDITKYKKLSDIWKNANKQELSETIIRESLSQLNEVEQSNYNKFPLTSLVSFAKRFSDFKVFSNWYSLELNHGYYWHLTDNKNFTVRNDVSPRDMSSMAFGSSNTHDGDLMITGDLEYWDENYNTDPESWKRNIKRNYVALFDATNLDPKALTQVSRGFGNEIYLDKSDAQKLKLIGVYDLKYAKQLNKKFENIIPQSEKELNSLWRFANK